MLKRSGPLAVMTLKEALKIAERPQYYRVGLWGRALSILMRYAAEPCLAREYVRRIMLCRKVYDCIGYHLRKMEAQSKMYRPPKKQKRRSRTTRTIHPDQIIWIPAMLMRDPEDTLRLIDAKGQFNSRNK